MKGGGKQHNIMIKEPTKMKISVKSRTQFGTPISLCDQLLQHMLALFLTSRPLSRNVVWTVWTTWPRLGRLPLHVPRPCLDADCASPYRVIYNWWTGRFRLTVSLQVIILQNSPYSDMDADFHKLFSTPKFSGHYACRVESKINGGGFWRELDNI